MTNQDNAETREAAFKRYAAGYDFLTRAGTKGRIVSSGDLTTIQIAEFQAKGQFWVDPVTSYGYAIVPWDLTTPKDRKRETAYFENKPV